MMTKAVASLWYWILLLFCQIQMKGLVLWPRSLLQVPILRSLKGKRLNESSSCRTLRCLGTGKGLRTLPCRIGLLSGSIGPRPLGIWSGCGSRGSEKVLIPSLLRKAISGFPLIWTGVGVPFGTGMWIGFGTGSRLFLIVPLSSTDNVWLRLLFSFVVIVTYVPEYIFCCHLG